jgi:WD40 repeat protein
MAVGEPLHGESAFLCIAFSPNSARFVSGSVDSIQLWNAECLTPIGRPLMGHSGAVYSVAFCPDSTRLVYGSEDTTVRLWNTDTGAEVCDPLFGHSEAVLSVVCHGDRIASGSKDTTIRLWNAKTGAPVGKPLTGHSGGVRSVAFSPDGTRLLSCSLYETLILVWKVENGAEVEVLFTCSECSESGIASCIAFSPVGTQFVCGDRHGIRLWDSETGKEISHCPMKEPDGVYSITFSPTGQIATASSADRPAIRLWNVQIDAAVNEPPIEDTRQIGSVAFSANGSQIVSVSPEGAIRRWNAKTGAAVGETVIGKINTFAISAGGTRIASVSDAAIQLWDAETGALISEAIANPTDGITCIALSFDGIRVAFGSYDATLHLWNVETGMVDGEPLTGHTQPIRCIAVSPDGTRIVSASYDFTIRLWDWETRAAVGEPLTTQLIDVTSIAISHDSKQIAYGSSYENAIQLWTTENGVAVSGRFIESDMNFRGVHSVTFSPDGFRIASCSRRGIQLWDAARGTAVGQPLIADQVVSIAFSPDGSHLVSGSRAGDPSIRLWNVSVGGPRGTSRLIYYVAALTDPHSPEGEGLPGRPPGAATPTESALGVQYPRTLFPLQSFRLKDGWILGPNDELVIWVPSANREALCHPGCRVISSVHPITELDFEAFKCGSEWSQCRG